MLIINCNNEALSYLERKPGANTIAYIPMENSITEESGNSTFTNYSVTTTTLNGVKCGYFNGSARLETNIPCYSNVNHTFNVWFKRSSNVAAGIICANPCGITKWDVLYYNNNEVVYECYNGSSWVIKSNVSTPGDRHNLCFSGGKLYVDGVQVGSNSGSYGTGYNYCIWGHTTGSSCTRRFVNGYMSRVIIENVARTASDVLDYYNKTKKYFGIS